MSTISTYVTSFPHKIILPPRGSTYSTVDYPTSPSHYGLIPISPYYYVNQEVYLEPDRMHPSGWPVRQISYHPYSPKSPRKRGRDFDEHEKPGLSYVEIIANAILESPAQRLVLSDIYDRILNRYPYFLNKGSGWRNSIRHNLSLSDCFRKGERSANGKGHFWEVDVQCYEDTLNGKATRNHRRKSRDEKKENSVVQLSPTEKKLSLVTLMKFDEEVKIFELASKKINGLSEALEPSSIKEID